MRKLILLAVAMVLLLPSSATGREAPESVALAQAEPRLSSEFRISWSTPVAAARHNPRAAYNSVSHQYMVVWHNAWPGGLLDIYAQRVTSSGKLLSHFTVATGAGGDGHDRWLPAVAYNATANEYLVVYMVDVGSNNYEVWGRRVSWDGALMSTEFVIFTWGNRAFWSPRVAWNRHANEYFVVANARDTISGKWNDVAGRRVTALGTTPYAGFNVSAQNQTLQPQMGDVASSGVLTPAEVADEFLVVWRQWAFGDDWDIYGARVEANTVVAPGPLLLDPSASDESYPAVTSDGGGRYGVVWQTMASSWGLCGKLLDLTGSTLGGFCRDYAFVAEQNPALALVRTESLPVVAFRSQLTGYADGIGGYFETLLLEVGADVAQSPPHVVSGPPGYLFVYGRTEGADVHIWGRLLWPATVFLPLALR